jgi:CDP-glycerol glycerophosphotransferase
MADDPQLSIILPVYNVESFLPECLDSILGQDFSDFELIVVDDCSPDGCAKILRKYQNRDPRVRVLSLDRNVGLGFARNTGLLAARGKYVWFLDSDDVVESGSLAKVMKRAAQTKADVVMFDWVRFFADGREKLSLATDALACNRGKFTAYEFPQIVRILQVAWNKIVRRDLLERENLWFPKGYYEDTAFTYALLASAKSIATLPATVVRYRQRSGAITATRSDRHFEVFGQWRLAMSQMARRDLDGSLTRELFPIMMRHCTYILMGSDRVPADRRSDYLKELQSLYREYGHLSGGGTRDCRERVEFGIIRTGSLQLLSASWTIRSRRWAASKRRNAPRRRLAPQEPVLRFGAELSAKAPDLNSAGEARPGCPAEARPPSGQQHRLSGASACSPSEPSGR